MSELISRTIKAKVASKLEGRITEYANKIIADRLRRAQAEAEEKLKKIVIDAIKGSLVYKGLSGSFSHLTNGTDLQAEFGLSDDVAEKALERMLEILAATIRVKISHSGGKVPAQIVASALNSEDYKRELEEGDEFSYTSIPKVRSKKGYKAAYGVDAKPRLIEWMKVILERNVDIIENIESFGISYDFKNEVGRSGRALMVGGPDKGLAETFPYTLPSIVQGNGKGDNFIDDIASDVRFRVAIAKQIEKTVYRVFNRRQALPNRLKG